ncbi:MAG: VanZ family protein [Clostridiaceae bacterium]
MKRYIRLTLVILWMAVIFYFSNQPALVSDEKSKFIIQLFELLGINLNSILGSMADFVVRKAAHFIEYMILFILWFDLLYGKYDLRRAIRYSIAAVFLYACTDEFHQMFVTGRAARFADIMIDLSGGCLGAAIRYLSLRAKGIEIEELKEEDLKQ